MVKILKSPFASKLNSKLSIMFKYNFIVYTYKYNIYIYVYIRMLTNDLKVLKEKQVTDQRIATP